MVSPTARNMGTYDEGAGCTARSLARRGRSGRGRAGGPTGLRRIGQVPAQRQRQGDEPLLASATRRWPAPGRPSLALTDLREALAGGTALRLRYRTSDRPECDPHRCAWRRVGRRAPGSGQGQEHGGDQRGQGHAGEGRRSSAAPAPLRPTCSASRRTAEQRRTPESAASTAAKNWATAASAPRSALGRAAGTSTHDAELLTAAPTSVPAMTTTPVSRTGTIIHTLV